MSIIHIKYKKSVQFPDTIYLHYNNMKYFDDILELRKKQIIQQNVLMLYTAQLCFPRYSINFNEYIEKDKRSFK